MAKFAQGATSTEVNLEKEVILRYQSRCLLEDAQWLFVMLHKEDPLNRNRRVGVCDKI
jgi:hypothetical protein